MTKASVREYAILYTGGKGKAGGASVGGGNVILNAGQHKLDGIEHLTPDDTTSLDATAARHGLLPKLSGSATDALLGDGTWGPAGTTDAELNIEGGQSVVNPLGSMGATASIDPTLGNVITGTLTADCTATITAPVGSGGSTLEHWVTQNGTGGWVLTHAATGGTVTDDGTLSPDTTAGATVRYILERIPGTTNDWVRNLVGAASPLTVKDEGTPLATDATSLDFVGAGVVASGTGAAKTITIPGGASALDDLSDVTITAVAADDTLRRVGTAWINDNRRWEPVTTNPGTGPEIVWDGDDIVMNWRAY